MDWIPVIVPGLLVLVLGSIAGGLAWKIVALKSRARVQVHEFEATLASLSRLQKEHEALLRKAGEMQGEDQRKADWLDSLERENDWFRQELERRPKLARKVYKILTVGVSGTGKTALTLKWANPLTDLGTLAGTKIDRYERTVSHVAGKDVATEHVFEIGDWGGEHIVDALQELIMDEVHGLLLVVDLAASDGGGPDPARIEKQLREFQSEALKFFFAPKTLASCKSVVLFINKSDVLAGTPSEVEHQARTYYGRLIEDLGKYKNDLDIRVLVGSATHGQSTHHLFAHFVERILPKTAYDTQLNQRIKTAGGISNNQANNHALRT